jgi:DNA polymerase epsilon subunit 1
MEKSGLDLYFIDRNGENFKASLVYAPYFYIDTKGADQGGHNVELMQHLQKRFENCRVELVDLEDLDMPNHLSGKTHQFIKISFGTVAELMDCKSIVRSVCLSLFLMLTPCRRPYVVAHSKASQNVESFEINPNLPSGGREASNDPLACISDMRENDVPYSMRCGIDLNLRVGAWFVVSPIEVCFLSLCLPGLSVSMSLNREHNSALLNGKKIFLSLESPG